MGQDTIRPNGDFSVNWTNTTGANHFGEVDEGFPADDSTTRITDSTTGTRSSSDEFDLTATANMAVGDTTTTITIRIRQISLFAGGDTHNLSVTLIIDGIDQGTTGPTAVGATWFTEDWTNAGWDNQNWSKSQIDAARVRITSDLNGAGKPHTLNIEVSALDVIVDFVTPSAEIAHPNQLIVYDLA